MLILINVFFSLATYLTSLPHDTAMECHLPYGITQCYHPPDTSEHTPP